MAASTETGLDFDDSGGLLYFFANNVYDTWTCTQCSMVSPKAQSRGWDG